MRNPSHQRRDRTIIDTLRVSKLLQTEFNMQYIWYVMKEML